MTANHKMIYWTVGQKQVIISTNKVPESHTGDLRHKKSLGMRQVYSVQERGGIRLDDLSVLTDKGHTIDEHLLFDLIKKMMQIDADKRITLLEVLQHPFFINSLSIQNSSFTYIEKVNIEVTQDFNLQSSWYQPTGPNDSTFLLECTIIFL